MQKSVECYLTLISDAVVKEGKKNYLLSEKEIESAYEYAKKGKMLPILCNTVLEHAQEKETPLLQEWKGKTMTLVMKQYGIYAALRKLLA